MPTGRVTKIRLFLEGLYFTLIFFNGIHFADYPKFDRVDLSLLMYCMSCSFADFFVEVATARPYWAEFLRADY